MWDINVKSTFFLIKECQEMLILSKEKGGAANILVVSSITGKNPNWAVGVYAMTKAALDNMIVGLAAELRADGIRVNAISPGLIKTDFSSEVIKRSDPACIGMPE